MIFSALFLYGIIQGKWILSWEYGVLGFALDSLIIICMINDTDNHAQGE